MMSDSGCSTPANNGNEGSAKASFPISSQRPRECVRPPDRKSTRLNSSHSQISYAVFCLKKKNNYTHNPDKTLEAFPLRHAPLKYPTALLPLYPPASAITQLATPFTPMIASLLLTPLLSA